MIKLFEAVQDAPRANQMSITSTEKIDFSLNFSRLCRADRTNLATEFRLHFFLRLCLRLSKLLSGELSPAKP